MPSSGPRRSPRAITRSSGLVRQSAIPVPYQPTYPRSSQSNILPTPHALVFVLVHGRSPGAEDAEVDRDPVHSPPPTARRGHADRRVASARRPCPPTAPRPARGRAPLATHSRFSARVDLGGLGALFRRSLARATTPLHSPSSRWWNWCVAAPCSRLPKAGHPTPETLESTHPVVGQPRLLPSSCLLYTSPSPRDY